MKRFILLLATVSLPALANPELEAILKKYQSTLMKFEVGMTSQTMAQGTDLEMDELGNLRTVMTSSKTNTILLKVEGSKAYEYEVITNTMTGAEEIAVNLTDYNFDAGSLNISNIRVVNDVLTMDMKGEQQDEFGHYSYTGSASKRLLSSMFCDFSSMMKGQYRFSQTGQTFLLMDQQTNQCGAKLPVAQLKQLDLSAVTFCDLTLPDDSEVLCESRDMSFLTADLK